MIFIPGKSCCVLCGEVMNSGEDMFMFPPITGNRKDPLFVLNDAGVHKECYHKFPHKGRWEAIWELWNDSKKNGRNICHLCNELIAEPDDHFSLGYLTLDKNNPLYEYNFLTLHKQCIPKIKEVRKLVDLLKDLLIQGDWYGNGIERRISTIEEMFKK